ncbi:hypothetical protein QCA50_007962 [Cerrena zonata]|uniref:Uncharacterized protein n=1 Tax=Cerrena zonata TaxID=2478898 RepID=A0AAW0G7I3_9APHY
MTRSLDSPLMKCTQFFMNVVICSASSMSTNRLHVWRKLRSTIKSPAKVDRSVLRIHLEERLAAYSPFDEMSIMLYEFAACTNRENRQFVKTSTLSSIDTAFATLLYPPSLAANLPILQHCLTIAGVPPCRQGSILESDSPQQFRMRFISWNREARVACSVVNSGA